MGTEIAVLENGLRPLLPHMAQALAGRMPAERLMRTVLTSAEKTPALLDCTRQSIFAAAMSAAVLGLEVDGVTGQAFLIPFNDRRSGSKIAQLVIGYRGMATLAARSGYTVTAGVVRDDDSFEYELGSGAFVRHRPKLGSNGRIMAAWACAASKDRPPIISVLSIGDIMSIKEKSPGAKRSDSPWNDPAIGFPAMAEKSARRRLARSMPLNADTRHYHLAARMDEAFEEQGSASAISSNEQLVIEGRTESPFPAEETSRTPAVEDLIGPKPDAETERWKRELMEGAGNGVSTMKGAWDRLCQASPRLSKVLKPYLDKECWPVAERADKEAQG